MSNPRFHYTEQYLLNPQHLITVDLVGLGGTGSQVLSALARMSVALQKLGHPGLHVRAWDGDTVSESNIGRQLFAPTEVGMSKAVALVNRVNRFFGTDWEAHPEHYSPLTARPTGRAHSNIIISCVDSVFARDEIRTAVRLDPKSECYWSQERWSGYQTERLYYWLDFGNTQKTGQVVLGTAGQIKQPPVSENQTAVSSLPHVFGLFPDLESQPEDASGPSCSLAEALSKQDLFINSTLCNLGMAILWKLFREYRITHHGAFLNLDTLSTNPINV